MASLPSHSSSMRHPFLHRYIRHPFFTTACTYTIPNALCPFSHTQHNDNNHNPISVPAIIVGGGPTGPFLSALLSCHSIPHLLFDGQSVEELTRHPQAHFINLRSMEILKSELSDSGREDPSGGLYERILRDMPPVKEWEAFHFGACVTGNGGKRLGRVVHPVGQALRVGQQGDAILAKAENEMVTVDKEKANADRVSPCQHAHLAQNKFVSLLLEEAKQTSNGSHLHYNEEIVNISDAKPCFIDYTTSRSNNIGANSHIISIHTSKNQTYHTRYLLACDGVHSFVRKHYNIPMKGESELHHMINVHFRTNGPLSKLLMQRSSGENLQNDHDHNQVMLHFIYNPQLVGAFVCHDDHAGEWVLQIPYFPPYQCIEEDFTENTVSNMIWFGLLGRKPTEIENCYDFDILSIRSWTMSSQVAERYVNDSHNIVLVGDAAHAFPPAGGFGMNTGLQDAHNLAWRLALMLHREKRMGDKCPTAHQSDSANLWSAYNSMLGMYKQDRRPITTQNAALSVRNYQRTLCVAKACYLNAQHPQLLMSMLGSPPMSFFPFEARQDVFRRLLCIATMPLGSLLNERDGENHSFHANHVERNVRSILENGGSLPLVFPSYELGFSYNLSGSRGPSSCNALDDSAGYHPRIQVGRRLPHIEVELMTSGSYWKNGRSVLETPHQKSNETNESTSLWISLVDVSSQLRRVHSLSIPLFTILVLESDLIKASALLQRVATGVMNEWDVPLILVNIHRERSQCVHESMSSMDGHTPRYLYKECKVDTLLDIHQVLQKLLLSELSVSLDFNQSQHSGYKQRDEINALLMIRPDGHDASVSCIDMFNAKAELETQLCTFIEDGFRTALGEVYIDMTFQEERGRLFYAESTIPLDISEGCLSSKDKSYEQELMAKYLGWHQYSGINEKPLSYLSKHDDAEAAKDSWEEQILNES